MAKSDTTDIILGVLGVLGVGALAVGAGYAGIKQAELLSEERLSLLRRLDKLEGKRIRDLTTREAREMRALRDRVEDIEDALGI